MAIDVRFLVPDFHGDLPGARNKCIVPHVVTLETTSTQMLFMRRMAMGGAEWSIRRSIVRQRDR
jgi:hypothetical protein